MKYINVRQLTRNLKEASIELPARVTRNGLPIFDIVPVDGQKILEKKIPNVKAVPVQDRAEESGHVCSWDRTFKCTSPGTVFVKGKYWCTPHSLEV